MCGIAGIFDLKGKKVDEGDVRAMAISLKHRGPDGIGSYAEGEIALGHTRLAVIDLKRGDQPIFNEDRSVVVVFNGEIYNFEEIRNELLEKGHQFSSTCDTEVIVHLYEEMGIDCVKRFRGMFAFALWDTRLNKLFLARDIVGKKPLYYALEEGRLFFASEIKALLGVGLELPINLHSLALFFKYQFIPGTESIYNNIYSVPPAHLLSIDQDGIDSRRYWSPPRPENAIKSEAEYCSSLRETLDEAVRIRLISDVPLGAFLSGGVDSAIVVGLMTQEKSEGVETFSIGFKDESYDETPFARQTAAFFKTRHRHETLEYDWENALPKILGQFDQPFGDASAIAVYQLSKMTRQSVTVALSGDGSDEIFAGYRRYVGRKLVRYYWRLPTYLRKKWLERVSDILPEGTAYYADSFIKQFRLFIQLSKRLEENPNEMLPLAFTDDDFLELLVPEIREQVLSNKENKVWVLAESFSNLDEVSQMMWTDFHSYLPDDILTKVDRMSMAHGLEVRSPFLDQKVIELVLKMPIDLKLKGFQTKYILKKTFQNFLPAGVTQRKKHGFMLPLATLFKKELKPFVEEILLKPGRLGIFNLEYIARLNQEHQNGFRDHSVKLWLLLVFRLWENRGTAHASF
ncbi:MAG: asparagine synthase (glutamine-hydrolyzing) [Nitrospirae bacterium]|nr:asparagine synthase (glutamine-hydrolyzing) [Candidatus Manganitrophaceae bacterium]